MSTHHTPMPWEVIEQSVVAPCPADSDYCLPLFMATDFAGPTESAANLILAAAAPELLAALKASTEVMVRAVGERLPIQQGTECEEHDWMFALKQARAAIAKAEGKQP